MEGSAFCVSLVRYMRYMYKMYLKLREMYLNLRILYFFTTGSQIPWNERDTLYLLIMKRACHVSNLLYWVLGMKDIRINVVQVSCDQRGGGGGVWRGAKSAHVILEQHLMNQNCFENS